MSPKFSGHLLLTFSNTYFLKLFSKCRGKFPAKFFQNRLFQNFSNIYFLKFPKNYWSLFFPQIIPLKFIENELQNFLKIFVHLLKTTLIIDNDYLFFLPPFHVIFYSHNNMIFPSIPSGAVRDFFWGEILRTVLGGPPKKKKKSWKTKKKTNKKPVSILKNSLNDII